MTVTDTPVLIVGGGPVGLGLAGDLGWRGVPCVLIEQSDGSIYQPRQDLVGIRTMEFCRRWGIAGDVEAAPYPRDYPQDNVYVAGSLHGWELGRHEVPALDSSRPPPQSPQKRERCPQNMFDPVLKKFASSFDCVDIRYRKRLVSFTQHADRVEAEIEDCDSGERSRVTAAYLAGCDGGRSTVRDAVGIAMVGNPAVSYTTNVIFRRAGFEAVHRLAPAYRYIFIGPEGTWATLVAINGRDQWRFSLIGDAERTEPRSEAEIHAAIRRAAGTDFDYELLSVVPWIRKELVAERMQAGRVFIAGDAAHVMSPTGGFGMNTGIGDAVDLSWKIDAVLAGWGGARLLDSYSIERRPVGERNVREAYGNFQRMAEYRNSQTIEDDSPEGAATRARVGREIADAMRREWVTLGIHLGYRYAGSPICWPDGTPLPEDSPGEYVQTARPGHRAPHVWLADGRSTLDLFGRGFVLLRLGADAPNPGPLMAAAERAAMPLTLETIAEPAVAASYERKLVLVRPDGHVAWRDDAVPADPAVVMDCARGA